MATSVLDYKTAIRARGYDGTSDDVLVAAIASARNDVASERRWSWLEVSGSMALVLEYDTPSESLSGATDLLYVDAVRIEYDTTRPWLEHLPVQELRDKEHNDRTPGVPQYWTQAAGQIRVWPSPDKAYTLSIDYIRRLTDPDNDDADQDLAVPPDFKSLVAWKACVFLAFRQREAWAMQYASDEYDRELRRKIAGESLGQRQTTDQVKPYYRTSYRDGVGGVW